MNNIVTPFLDFAASVTGSTALEYFPREKVAAFFKTGAPTLPYVMPPYNPGCPPFYRFFSIPQSNDEQLPWTSKQSSTTFTQPL